MTAPSGGVLGVADWHRGWHISKSFFGYWFQHPGFDRENATDWRYGHAATVQDARDEIDRLLEDDAEWTAASRMVAALRSAAEAARAGEA